MKFSTIFAGAMLAAVASLTTAAVEVEDGVYVLGDDTFADFVKENEFVLAEFYAPWCGHCKSLAPEYSQAAKELAETSVKLAKVDATVHTQIASKYDVKGYPTLKFFRSGNVGEYGGGRKAPEIVSWLTKKTGPVAVTLETVDALSTLQEAKDVLVVGVFDDVESAAAKAFLAVAAGLDDVSFGITSNADVRSELKVEGDAVALLKQFDEGRNDYEGDFSEATLKEFISGNSLPIVMEFNAANQPKIFGGDIKTHMLLFVTPEEYKENLQTCYEDAARQFKGKVIFITVDPSAEASGQVMNYFKVEKSPTAMRLINMDNDMLKFVPEGEITCETFEPFMQKFVDGELQPHLNSEDVPEDWNAEPVKVLVGKNFHEVAFDEKKDVFVEFYAPWCGHCKSLAPIWDELAEGYESNDNVVIAKMDSTANEVKEVSVKGFPTLKFFPAGSKDILDYEGARTLEALKEYVDAKVGSEAAEETQEEAAEGHEEL
ncbi:hypothetical protein SARC_03846 [Sphaeroforma arctica JP610]|uniref:Protein disulfide-isomerase n=1 Tax=Sphaeroforma arctica JP610 TaxID=667725 RepID=A0A0L0G530_9EUKA|nr:hypothetical protein SARC_03846 [Sphaeroforma arctica JP610]KNC83931.1 hypothetical protein SARC_03846 [Sphaeroforma arctica JP610]|eukprot:XP_014157833.1 hypothetical protein SARC_03846 [Sphaeroforma arctica JP610]